MLRERASRGAKKKQDRRPICFALWLWLWLWLYCTDLPITYPSCICSSRFRFQIHLSPSPPRLRSSCPFPTVCLSSAVETTVASSRLASLRTIRTELTHHLVEIRERSEMNPIARTMRCVARAPRGYRIAGRNHETQRKTQDARNRKGEKRETRGRI